MAGQKSTTTPAAAGKKSGTRKKVIFTLQFAGKEQTVADMEEKAVAAWVEHTGGCKKDAKSIQLYAKPEDDKLYYVINGEAGYTTL
jgi:ABC-type hemin transport system substrate-binding protein